MRRWYSRLRKWHNPAALMGIGDRLAAVWPGRASPLVAVHRLDTDNLGDRVCSPALYFDFLRGAGRYDLIRVPRRAARRARALVIGGGGLLDNDYFRRGWTRLLDATTAELIGWGLGHNHHGRSTGAYPAFLTRFSLVGVRDEAADRPRPFDWVPCVSCMHAAFDVRHEVTTEVVCYQHRAHPLHLPGIATMTNTQGDLPTAIRFLASADTVLTNTYHGMYWASLLGRKVVVFPYSSKFYGFRYPVAMGVPDDWQAARVRAVRSPEALDECRHANVRFAAKVRDRLGALAR